MSVVGNWTGRGNRGSSYLGSDGNNNGNSQHLGEEECKAVEESGIIKSDCKNSDGSDGTEHGAETEAAATKSHEAIDGIKDEEHRGAEGEAGISLLDGARSQNKEEQESGVQIVTRITKNKHEEAELEEGELPESEEEDNTTNIPAHITEVNDRDILFESKVSTGNTAEVSLKRAWSPSSYHGSEIRDVLLNKRRCLCGGKNEVEEVHERIENVITRQWEHVALTH